MRHLLCTGFFALEGETTCAHRCADAAALGVAGSVACDMTAGASGGAVAALTFAQIRGITPQPFSDWYAIVCPTAPPHTADANRTLWEQVWSAEHERPPRRRLELDPHGTQQLPPKLPTTHTNVVLLPPPKQDTGVVWHAGSQVATAPLWSS